MNTERIRELADVIEDQPHTSFNAANGFYMDAWEHSCGTPSCIAGWAAHTFGRQVATWEMWDVAEGLLGLSEETSRRLFLGDGTFSRGSVTPAHAAAVLRNLADNGVVDWSVGAPATS